MRVTLTKFPRGCVVTVEDMREDLRGRTVVTGPGGFQVKSSVLPDAKKDKLYLPGVNVRGDYDPAVITFEDDSERDEWAARCHEAVKLLVGPSDTTDGWEVTLG